jgi:Domain of unknown function (DUF4136)
MKTLVVIALIAFAPLVLKAQKVKVTSAAGADFSRYKTYSWDQGMMANPLIRQTVIAAVDNALAAKGLQKVEKDPDLIMSALASTESNLTVTNPSWTPTLNSIATGIPTSNVGWPVTKGTLMILISDARTKNEVWQGTATHTLEQGPTGDRVRDAKKVEQPINKAVQKMFKKFPPQSKH